MANYQSQYTGEQIDEAVGKVGKALVTPDTSPSSVVIPAIGTDNAQTNLTLGDGLSVTDGVISASGGGGGGDKALIVYVPNGYRTLNVYFDNEGTGTVEGTIKSSSSYKGFYYFTGFTDYVYFKGEHEDDISVEDSGKAVNCNVEFSDTYSCQAMKVSNINGIGMVTIRTSKEPV